MTDATDGSGATPRAASGEGPGLRRLDPANPVDVADCLALSTVANWNQTAADWSLMLAAGWGWGWGRGPGGGGDGDGGGDGGEPGQDGLVASALALPFPAPTGLPFAWISMVLVHPAWRGLGLATRLVDTAVAALRGQGIVAVLDATPAGFPVYRRLGFEPTWGFARYRREAAAARDGTNGGKAAGHAQAHAEAYDAVNGGEVDCGLTIRPLSAADWPAIVALDRPAFGADRGDLLRALAARLPAVATVAERHGKLIGYCLGRDGREASQLGPLLAPDPATARALLVTALAAVPGPVHLDLADRHDGLLPWLEALGFRHQRPFTRMVLGASTAPGDAAPLVLMAGPELG